MSEKNKIKYRITIDPQYSDGEQELGLEDIAFTKNPAIMLRGFAFNNHKSKKTTFSDEKKYRIVAPAMIPMEIYRYDSEEDFEYYVEFTKEVIEEIYVKMMSENNLRDIFNLEHNQDDRIDAFILESWIVGEDNKKDKSYSQYGLEVPSGTLMITAQFNNKEQYNELVKNEQTGFSIEGFLGMALELNKQEFQDTYTDYPQQATENAKIALKWAEENGWGECGTAVGKARANQLAKREPISRDTIARMAAFERHRQNSDKELGDGCGRLMWQAWGGDAGIEWAQKKLEQIDNKTNKQEMENLMLQDGQYTINEKIYIVKDGKIELKEVEKEEMSVEEEAVIKDAAEDIADDSKKEEMAEDVKEDEEAPIVEDAAEDIADKVEEEKMAVDPELDAEAILAIIQPKLEEIYKMIGDLKAGMSVEDDVEEVIEEVKLSSQEIPLSQKFTNLINFLKD